MLFPLQRISMCILFIAIKQHPDFPLIIAANRDEFTQRPTQAADFWPQHPHMLAGKDLKAGGSWMGVNTQGRIAAVTNIRDPASFNTNKTSRGDLVTDFLTQSVSSEHYAEKLSRSRDDYNGYNLLYGEIDQLQVFNSYSGDNTQLGAGVWGLSNASLNSPWPKVNLGMAGLKSYCQTQRKLDPVHLFTLLKNTQIAADHLLPDTGMDLESERKLSSIFIQGKDYATRSSTVLLMDKKRTLHWFDQTWDHQGKSVRNKEFTIPLATQTLSTTK